MSDETHAPITRDDIEEGFTQIVGDEENNTRLGEISADYGPFRASQDAAAEVRIARKREAIG